MMLTVSLEEGLARTHDISLAGEVKMTKWAEWGVLSAPMRFVPAKRR